MVRYFHFVHHYRTTIIIENNIKYHHFDFYEFEKWEFDCHSTRVQRVDAQMINRLRHMKLWNKLVKFYLFFPDSLQRGPHMLQWRWRKSYRPPGAVLSNSFYFLFLRSSLTVGALSAVNSPFDKQLFYYTNELIRGKLSVSPVTAFKIYDVSS